MAEAKKAKRITRGKVRLVSKSKWELPMRGSTLYWKKICESIESKVIRVRNSSVSHPTLYPGTFSSIRDSASSVSIGDVLTKHLPAAEAVDASLPEPIVKIYPPSPPSRNATARNANWILRAENSQSNREKECDDRPELENPWKIMKLSKMTKLVNEFLSSTRTKVRPHSGKPLLSPRRKIESRTSRRAELTRVKSFEDHSNDDESRESSKSTMTPQRSRQNPPDSPGEARPEKRSVIFREDIEEIVERFHPNENIAEAKPRRPRAPSLSVASALPSFGRVVISIESISSAEDDEDHGKTNRNNDNRTFNLISKDSRSKPSENQSNLDSRKVTQDFLRVPEIRTVPSSYYPGHEGSVPRKQISINQTPTQTQTERVSKSQRLKEAQVLQKKYGFWPRRSIVHMFRALKAMKHGSRSRARIESETNRFFAAPLEIYSPSARSSISSDDQADFVESGLDHNDDLENGNGSEEDLGDQDSEFSYTSIRQRLMRNAQGHVRDDFQPTGFTLTDENNAFLSSDSSRSYNSRSSAGGKIKMQHRNTKTSATHDVIALPRIAAMFPRKKSDKCLACMCKSLEEINQTARAHDDARRFSKVDNETLLFEEPTSRLSPFPCLNRESFDQSSKMPVFEDDLAEKFPGEDYPGRYLSSTFAAWNEESIAADIPPLADPDSAAGSSTRSTSQLDPSHQPRALAKSIPKTLVSAKSLVSSLSMASERSRSISDQDDSDQGCAEPGIGEIALGPGGTSKNLAPCHMPLNLKPSLEPLKALRLKKSRSIRSRIASAEKSAGSVSGDEEDSDADENDRRLAVNATKIKAEVNEATMKIDVDGSTGKECGQQRNVAEEESENRSEGSPGSESSKIDLANGKSTEYDEPIICDRDVIKIATRCLAENKNVVETLRVLAKEYSNRLANLKDNRSVRLPNLRRTEKIANNLLALLVDSKSYLNRGKCPNNLTDLAFSSKQPPLCNSRQLRRALPLKSYNLVAPILGMAKWYPKRRTSGVVGTSKSNFRHKESSGRTFDLVVHPPSRVTYRVSFEEDWDDVRPKLSPYALFLSKPRRKAVTWRPLTERDLEGYDPEATLKMRATRITDRICEDFCQWLRSLSTGTDHTSAIDVDVLKDMFETDFTAEVCRTMQVSINEMPMVPDAVATARNCPEAAELALTRRHLVKDAEAEKKPRRTVGFGTALPNHLKFLPPRNNVDEQWLQCKNVPTDLETMDAVWKDITQLTSVQGFIEWLKAHPRVSRPKALEKALASEESLTRQSQEMEAFKDHQLDIDQIQSLKVGDNASDV